MLVGPLKTLRQFLVPALAGLIGLGTQQPRWLLLAAPVVLLGAVGIGVLPWVTTRFRIADDQLVVTRGLLNRTRLTAPVDRIRSVDLAAPLLHRALGIHKVQIGTGVDDTMIELDSLSDQQAEELRSQLLALRQERDPASEKEPPPGHQPYGGRPPTTPDLARFQLGWVRFAPFSLGRLVIALGALGGLSQFIGDLHLDVDRDDLARLRAALFLVLTVLVVGGLVAWVLVSMAAYLVQWWALRLFREDGNLRLTRGLFTTASTTLEEARVRGVQLKENAALRPVGGAELHALVTGLDEGVYAVLPPSPAAVTTRVGADIIGDPVPLETPLRGHGPRARRRCWVRGLRAVAVLPVVVAAVSMLLSWSPWPTVITLLATIALALLLGEAEHRHLGHALTTQHLIAGSGVTARIRTVLQREGVIGWVVSQTWFQRRRGLADLVATTAAGAEKVLIRDLDLSTAIALADRATPGMLDEFRTR